LVLVHGFGLDGRMWDEQFAIMGFALRYPTAVSHLVLANSVLDGFRMSETWDNSVIPLYTHGRAGDLAMAKHLWLSHPLFTPALQNERGREQLQQIVTDYSGWHWLHQDPGTGPTTPTIERLNEIQAPTLVIIGELDLPDFHLVTDMLQQQIPQAQKVNLPGAGHMSNMESPERFNEAVLNFLSMV
jgi:pimeloyl-ACP methyl ester carboxylesterase